MKRRQKWEVGDKEGGRLLTGEGLEEKKTRNLPQILKKNPRGSKPKEKGRG